MKLAITLPLDLTSARQHWATTSRLQAWLLALPTHHDWQIFIWPETQWFWPKAPHLTYHVIPADSLVEWEQVNLIYAMQREGCQAVIAPLGTAPLISMLPVFLTRQWADWIGSSPFVSYFNSVHERVRAKAHPTIEPWSGEELERQLEALFDGACC